MRQFLEPALLWFSAIGCGLMAGVYFAFSTFIMTAFSRIAPAAGIAAMNAIEVEIVKSLFMPIFLGTTLTAAALAGLAIFRWGEPGAAAMLVGGIIYVLGMFAVTMFISEPMNQALLVVDPASVEGASFWENYVRDWNMWNHVRTVCSTLAAVLFTWVLVIR